jgi:hypothetical protein
MIRRTLWPLLLALVLSALFLPQAAFAQRHPVRGQVLNQNITLKPFTSSCACDARWYTVGLRPGTVRVSAQVLACGMSRNPTCGINVFLLQAANTPRTVRVGQASCSMHPFHCGAAANLAYSVTQQGVYYMLVRGLGADSIRFSLRLQGNLYTLHCTKYC